MNFLKNISQRKYTVVFLLICSMCQCISGYSQKRDFPYALDLKKELTISGIGLGAISLYKIGESSKTVLSLEKIGKLNKNDINSFDRKTVNNWSPNKNKLRESFEPMICVVSTATAAYAGTKFQNNDKNINKLFTLGTMYAEGLLITYGLKKISKLYIDRYRPYMYNPNVPTDEKLKPGGNESFYSGNAAIMFYNSAYISKIYSDLYPDSQFKYIIMGIGLGWSSYSAWLSVKSGKHFLSDVISGALLGAFTGYLIPHLHLKSSHKKRYKLSLYPSLFENSKTGITIALKL